MEAYFWLLVGLVSLGLLIGLSRPVQFYQFPCIMAVVFGVFILPQAVSLMRFPGAASPEAVQSVLAMTCLCLVMCFVGYRLPVSRWVIRHASVSLNPDRLFHGGIAFVLCGYFFNYLISQMTFEETGGSMWTGRVTIYGFFANLIYPGFSICLTTLLRGGGPLPLLFTILGSIPPMQAAIFFGRREGAVLFALAVALTMFYQRRWRPSRLLVAGAILFAMLAIPATGTYRGLMAEQDYKAVQQLDLVENFQKFVNDESILELRNAAMLIDATAKTGAYEYGAAYWDAMVFRFIPAQLLGNEFKASLMFRSSESRALDEMARRGYRTSVGSTTTGMGDSFQQFGYFGCLFFALLAVIYRSLWLASLLPNAMFAQLLYIQTATSGMRAITHQTMDYLPGLTYNLIFIGLVALYARDKHQEPLMEAHPV
jgi:hypothetical protein